MLRGGNGDDLLLGGSGTDDLDGEKGIDNLKGGAGTPDKCDSGDDADQDTADAVSCENVVRVP